MNLQSRSIKSHRTLFRFALTEILRLARPHSRALLLSFLLMLAGQIARLFLPFSAKYFFDSIVLKHDLARLPQLIVAVFLASIIDALTYFLSSQMLTRVSERIIADLRKRLQRHIVSMPLGYFDGILSGAIASRVMSDVEGLRNFFGTGMMVLCLGILTATISFAILVSKGWSVTLLFVGVLGLIAVVLKKTFGFIRPLLREANEIRSRVSGRLTEEMAGIRTIKGFCAEALEADAFSERAEKIFENAMKSRTGFSLLGLMGTASFGMTTTLIMFIGGRRLLAGSWTTGDYVQYAAILGYFVGPLFQLVNIGSQLNVALTGLERASEILSKPVEDAMRVRTTRLATVVGELEFDNVSFDYVAGQPVLDEISFVSQPDTVTALVGPSGAGKTTITALIAAFYLPKSGRILVGGIDISTVQLDSYRRHLGLVLQEPFLFDGSIRDNLLFANPEASEEKLLRACRIACVDEFAERLPTGYETIVGERGVKLSGGQRQRLSLARAILADPRILILDEATSALDSESEAMIQDGLNYLMKGRMTFVIAHRLSTIRKADQILVIEKGRIIERGTHESLYVGGGRYYELYTKQYGVEMNLFTVP